MSRLIAGATRAFIMGVLFLLAVVTGLVGLWSYTGPPVIMYHREGSFFERIDSSGWRLGFRFGEFRDIEWRTNALSGYASYHLQWKGRAGQTIPNAVKNFGPLEFGCDSGRQPVYECAFEVPSLSVAEQTRSRLPTIHVWVTTPAWVPCPVFAAYPVWAFVHGPLRRRRRRAKGLCVRCGYDLTGNVTGVCPECGTAVPESVRSVVVSDYAPTGPG